VSSRLVIGGESGRNVLTLLVMVSAWVLSVGLFLRAFGRLTPVIFYCLSYLGLLLIAQWAFSKDLGGRLRRALVLTVVMGSLWFVLAIISRIIELLPEITQYF